jgi:hypothetical protein
MRLRVPAPLVNIAHFREFDRPTGSHLELSDEPVEHDRAIAIKHAHVAAINLPVFLLAAKRSAAGEEDKCP